METSSRHPKLKSFDYTGIFFSILCLAHCLLLPMVMSLAPALTSQLENEWIHFALLGVLIPVALISFVGSRKHHKKASPVILGCVGVLFLLSAVVIEHIGIHGWESRLTLLGSVLLISAHVLNLKHKLSMEK